MNSHNIAFLILGAGRGGTSLLAGLLDFHTDLEVGFELFSQDCLMGEKLQASGKEIFNKRVEGFIAACHQEATQFLDKRWGIKITTEQLFGLEDHNVANPYEKIDILECFLNQYLMDVEVVFILRDGRTCVRSKVSRTGQPIELACSRWKYSVKVLKFLKNHHTKNIVVKYEDLVTNPSDTLTRICTFLNIPYQPPMLAGTNSPKMLPEYRRDHFDTSNLHLHNIHIPKTCYELMVDDLKFCDYLNEV